MFSKINWLQFTSGGLIVIGYAFRVERRGAFFVTPVFVKLKNMYYYCSIGYLLCFYILSAKPYQTMQLYRIINSSCLDDEGNITDFSYIF